MSTDRKNSTKRHAVQLPGETSPVQFDNELKAYLLTDDFGSKLFQELIPQFPRTKTKMSMYGKPVETPRFQFVISETGEEIYKYSGMSLPATRNEGKEMTKLIRYIQNKYGDEYKMALLNLYVEASDNVGWHQDNEETIVKDTPIISISLGGTRMFAVRRKYTKQDKNTSHIFTHELQDCDVVVMPGGMQTTHMHALLKGSKQQNMDKRINITFRQYQTAQRKRKQRNYTTASAKRTQRVKQSTSSAPPQDNV